MIFTRTEAVQYYSARVPGIKINSQKEWRGKCPIHNGDDLNFEVQAETGLSRCFSVCGGRGWDMISLEQELMGLDFIRAKESVFRLVGRSEVPWEERNVEEIYDYADENGEVLYQVLRYYGKDFKQRRPDGQDGWKWGLGNTERVPFHLPQLSKSKFAAVVEGERDVLTLERMDMTATCNNGGAGNFKPELAPYFTGKDVAIFPDNDDPGRDHAMKVAQLLTPVAKSVKIVELPNLPLKGDVTDFVNAGGTIHGLRELYRKAQAWSPDWEFAVSIPDENEKYSKQYFSMVEEESGLDNFWNIAKLSGLETPWKPLSYALGGGLKPGEIYIIGGNSGSGKTSLALQFAIAAMRRGEGVLLFSMEMPHKSIFQRMTAIEARIDLNELRSAQIASKRHSASPEERQEAQAKANELCKILSKHTAELINLPLIVSSKSGVTPEYVAQETKRLAKKHKINLVIVDHMQLMEGVGSARGDYEKFTGISRSMKKTAVDIGPPILILSQTSRAQFKEHRAELEISDLRATGALEEDAAAVMLLYEDLEDKKLALSEGDGSRYSKGPVKTILKLGKNRYGEQGRQFLLRHFKTYTRFDPFEA